MVCSFLGLENTNEMLNRTAFAVQKCSFCEVVVEVLHLCQISLVTNYSYNCEDYSLNSENYSYNLFCL